MGFLEIGIIFYFIIGIFWGLYSMVQQEKIYPDSSEIKTMFIGLLNYIIWPISMIVALIRKITGNTLGK